jgi:hypothetical protein
MSHLLNLRIVNGGVCRCSRCDKPIKERNHLWIRGDRGYTASQCVDCYLWTLSNQKCVFRYGIDLAEKRRRYEAQDCCCAICRNELTFEKRLPNQRPAGSPRTTHRTTASFNAKRYNPYFAVMDHKKSKDNPRRRVTSGGKIGFVSKFMPGDMLRAILCNLCNIAVGHLEEHGHQIVHPAVHDYLTYWNEQYRLFIAADPIIRQQSLDFGLDLDDLQIAA